MYRDAPGVLLPLLCSGIPSSDWQVLTGRARARSESIRSLGGDPLRYTIFPQSDPEILNCLALSESVRVCQPEPL